MAQRTRDKKLQPLTSVVTDTGLHLLLAASQYTEWLVAINIESDATVEQSFAALELAEKEVPPCTIFSAELKAIEAEAAADAAAFNEFMKGVLDEIDVITLGLGAVQASNSDTIH